MDPDIIKIIEAGTHAPSGDNSQPWEFRFNRGSRILELHNLTDKDNPYYNFQQYGSLFSHGSVLENMLIASSAMGYDMSFSILPNPSNPNQVAAVSFSKSASRVEPLYNQIFKRVTNRKPYNSKIKLTKEQINVILSAGNSVGAGKVLLTEDRETMLNLGKAVSVNEIIALEMKKLHDIFFNHIVWTQEEEENKKSGLFINTLELPPPIKTLFRFLKNWKFASFLNGLGFSKLAAAGNAKIYSSGAAQGIIAMNGNSAQDYVLAGRVMQRVWLEATRMGLSLQLIAGTLFLAQRIFAGQGSEMSSKHIELVNASYDKIKKAFGVGNETITMFFRIGSADEPSARSSRKSPEIKLI